MIIQIKKEWTYLIPCIISEWLHSFGYFCSRLCSLSRPEGLPTITFFSMEMMHMFMVMHRSFPEIRQLFTAHVARVESQVFWMQILAVHSTLIISVSNQVKSYGHLVQFWCSLRCSRHQIMWAQLLKFQNSVFTCFGLNLINTYHIWYPNW